MQERFLKAIEEVLGNEGGLVNDPKDPGGLTKYGISQRTYPHLDIANLTRDEAVEIYYRDWWLKNRYFDIANAELAAELLDIAVNIGHRAAVVILQRAVMRTDGGWLNIDGDLGDLTIAAVNRHPYQGWLLDQFKLLAIEYYLSLRKSRYLAGWVKRALN